VLSDEHVWFAYPDRECVPERAHLVAWVRNNVPAGEPIAADFVTSAGLLFHTRHPSLLQPKYETVRSRRRIEAFFASFYRGTPADFRAWMEAHGSRWFVLDRQRMWDDRYVAGIPMQTRDVPGHTAAAWFLAGDEQKLKRAHGFELVYRSPQRYGLDSFRVYRLQPR
jgi:hypothetical protein